MTTMTEKRKALGRGLDSLLPGGPPVVTPVRRDGDKSKPTTSGAQTRPSEKPKDDEVVLGSVGHHRRESGVRNGRNRGRECGNHSGGHERGDFRYPGASFPQAD